MLKIEDVDEGVYFDGLECCKIAGEEDGHDDEEDVLVV